MQKEASDVRTALCPAVEHAFEVLGRKWAGLIIRELSSGALHFCELERGIPSMSARMLTERIKELEGEGILTRTVSAAPPVRVLYELTEKGRALIPVMKGIEAWAHQWGEA